MTNTLSIFQVKIKGYVPCPKSHSHEIVKLSTKRGEIVLYKYILILCSHHSLFVGIGFSASYRHEISGCSSPLYKMISYCMSPVYIFIYICFKPLIPWNIEYNGSGI